MGFQIIWEIYFNFVLHTVKLVNEMLTAAVITFVTGMQHKVKEVTKLLLTLRQLMSYIYGAPILDVSRSHTTTQHSR